MSPPTPQQPVFFPPLKQRLWKIHNTLFKSVLIDNWQIVYYAAAVVATA